MPAILYESGAVDLIGSGIGRYKLFDKTHLDANLDIACGIFSFFLQGFINSLIKPTFPIFLIFIIPISYDDRRKVLPPRTVKHSTHAQIENVPSTANAALFRAEAILFRKLLHTRIIVRRLIKREITNLIQPANLPK
jgi:hypothetical protein